ncbi:Eukaryotic translation initiation factor 4 gamma 1 [Dinochytrium kinnereticum]|nr:Eukaryotic translation initiation factor 4 gamma 1 [Dinochytrium kinnereticum]
MGLLNKLTPEKFDGIAGQIAALPILSESLLVGIVDLIFSKAVSEKQYQPSCAKVCAHLDASYSAATGSEIGRKFRQFLLDKLQKEFKKGACWASVDQEDMEKLFRVKREALGNLTFIGELFKAQLVHQGIVHDCLTRLLNHLLAMDEDGTEALCIFIQALGMRLEEMSKAKMKKVFSNNSKVIVVKRC